MSFPYKTSIIILTYNKLEYTQACIDSIRQYTPIGTYQLIIVDNCSTDGTREWLMDQTDILTIFNEENVGFPKGCNQGIGVATGDNILLLNNDVLVTANWLELLNDCLYSSEDVGAVGPVSNSAYGDQEIPANYSTLDEMWSFSNSYNANTNPDWEQKLKLIGFCMLIKREVVDKVGLLDEIFSPGMCEDSDYSLRIIKAGYKLILCRNVFIHHFGSTSFGEMQEQRQKLWSGNREKFEQKWGFPTAYPTPPEELVQLMDEEDFSKKIRVLDVGCAFGAGLLKVKHKYPNAELFGIEKNPNSAGIAKFIGNISVCDAEDATFEKEQFDFIILGDVLHQLKDPWVFIEKLIEALKPTGKLIASVPNAAHYSIIYALMKNQSLYSEGSYLRNRDNLRFLTLEEIKELFEQSGFEEISYKAVHYERTSTEQKFIDMLQSLSGLTSADHLSATKYIVRAEKKKSTRLILKNIVLEIDQGKTDGPILQLIGLLEEQSIKVNAIIEVVNSMDINRQHIFNILATHFFNHGLYNDIIPLLNASLEINQNHRDTLYNFAFILHKVGADEEAIRYLSVMTDKDEESQQLFDIVRMNLSKE